MSGTRSSSLLGKVTVLIVICCFVMGSFVVNTAAALDGSGTEGDPWLIQSLEDFNDFAADANYWDDYTRLETDVNLAGRTYSTAVIAPDVNNVDHWFQGASFTGVFDGNNHKIINLTINDGGAGNSYLGLFGCIGDGEVNNLSLEGGSVIGIGPWVGGLVGENTYGSISNCYSTGIVEGAREVGGLVGMNYGIVSNCYSTGSVSGGKFVGDLVGLNAGSVSNCYSSGSVNGDENVGGLVGYNLDFGSVSNCYSISDVSGPNYVGGLVGTNSGSVSYCYATGDVNSVGLVGGLAGRNYSGNVSNCFWDTDTQTHGVTDSFGKKTGTVTNVEGLPTSQMQTRSTFTDVDWDFINVWNIGENQTYPYLRTVPAADLNKDGIVNFLDLNIICNQWMQE
jgi:hypothetical protein